MKFFLLYNMKILFVILIIVLTKGCFSPFKQDISKIPDEKRYNNMIQQGIDDILEFAKKYQKSKIGFDLIIIEFKDFDDFAILTLETPHEIKVFPIYSMAYLNGFLYLLSKEVYDKNYNWSWNLFLINIRKQLKEQGK